MVRPHPLLQIHVREQLARPLVRPAHHHPGQITTADSESRHRHTGHPFFNILLGCVDTRQIREPTQTSHEVDVHLVLIIDTRQARLDGVSNINHAIFIDQSHSGFATGSRNQIPAALGAHPTAKMAVDGYNVKAVAI
jgi:hypothetical protein